MKRLSGRPGKLCSVAKAKWQQQMFFILCESEAAATNVFFCAKAKRQQQSVQSERKLTPRFAEE
ncbi:hypothetical protein PVA17_15560 [Lysinibacillus sp. CNPSo 3705]|uniref:hypothetical protein n=1 Tax=Lysinibacillus sp. CNPSo 3705 TaxID=3028148 RepID=UPI002363ACBF|nr:hypothetical protein [Lysinibacillus sp. CNPSo 3705]MDD1504161.1 hypothetical protein [Lysinibacillus sp. CNPSo 3705]